MFIRKTHYLTFCIILTLLSYSTSSKLTGKGDELEKAGLNEEAAQSYYRALTYDKDNIDAKIGLKRTAPKILDNMIIDFRNMYNLENYEDGYVKFNEALKYQDKIEHVGVIIDISVSDERLFENAKNNLAEKYYKMGKNSMHQRRWSSAVDCFVKVQTYISNYEETDKLLVEAKGSKNTEMAENFYKKGQNYFNSENFKLAYKYFSKCLQKKQYYKDATSLKNESLEKGKIRIGIFPFKNDTRLRNVENTLYAYVLSNAVNYPSPFIEVIDRDNLSRLLREQSLGMSGIIDESSAAKAGLILGLKAVVLGKLIDIQSTDSEIKKTPVDAYELYGDNIGKLKGKKVNFFVYEGTSRVVFKSQYQIIDTETSRILSSDIVTSSAEDNIKYATYNGNIENLTLYDPGIGTWGMALGKGLVGDIDKTLFSARKKLKSSQEMSGEIIENLGYNFARKICEYFD